MTRLKLIILQVLALIFVLALGPVVQAASVETPDVKLAFHELRIVVQDVAGPDGLPEPDVPWRITIAATELEAIATHDSLAEGKTDKKGEANLGANVKAALYAAWRDRPAEKLWFIGDRGPFILTPQTVNGKMRIVLVKPKSPYEITLEAKRVEEEANRAKRLPADVYIQAGFKPGRFKRDLADWQARFNADIKTFTSKMKSAPNFGRELLQQEAPEALAGIFTDSIDPGFKGLHFRRLLLEASYSRDRRVSPPGAVISGLLLSNEMQPVGFGGNFEDGDRNVELWYVTFDDLTEWSVQDFKTSPIFEAFSPAELPPFGVIKRNAWPALVFVRNQDGKLLLYGLSWELDRIARSVFAAQVF